MRDDEGVRVGSFGGLAGAAGVVAALRGAGGRRISPYELLLMTAGTAVAGSDYLQLIYAYLQQAAEKK